MDSKHFFANEVLRDGPPVFKIKQTQKHVLGPIL